jgi:uncharacterized repeat protein (TIGR02543 family)
MLDAGTKRRCVGMRSLLVRNRMTPHLGARVNALLIRLALAVALIFLVATVAPAASSATTTRTPGVVRSVRASLVRSTATVRWLSPLSDGGSKITRYRAIAHPSGRTCTTAGRSCTVSQLTNKTTYRFSVEAMNERGSGRASSLSNPVTVKTGIVVVVPPPAPSPPTTTPTTTTTIPSGGGGGGGGGGAPAPTTYTVTFSANGGTGSMSTETESSPTALTANAYTYPGHNFAGWNTSANGSVTAYANDATYPFTASATLYAQWTVAASYTVTFNANGGTGSMTAETQNQATALTFNSFARSGYAFVGWSTTANGSLVYANGASYPFTASVTLYALWAQLFTVTFNANGGTNTMASETAGTPTALTPNAFTRSGYNFSGWNTSANGAGTAYANDATYPFTASVTLYAQWTVATPYTVTFNSNGEAGSMSPETASSPTVLTSNTFTPAYGYVFSGWNTNANGSGTAYANGATYGFSASLTLYAQWLAILGDSNWTGYVDTAGTFSAVSASWVVPTVTCTQTAYASQWVGIDGESDSTVEQDGTETDCNGTTPVYDAWYEMYGYTSVNGGYEYELSPSSYPVAPGNQMNGSVRYAGGVWTLAIADTTAGWSYSIPITVSTPAGQSSAEWIMETPKICNSTCSLEPLSDFGSATFSNASVTINGAVGTISSEPFVALATLNGSDVLMLPGQVDANGTSFGVTWDRSS